jgi:hypothetical protein
MEKNKYLRSKSAIRPKLCSSKLSLDQVLKIINPLGKEKLELEDMKRILSKIPEHTRLLVQQIFHNYIFNSKNFLLETSEFCKMYDNLKNVPDKDYEDSHSKSQYNQGIGIPESSKFSSDFLEEEEKGYKKNSILNRSISPERPGKINTYVQIYQEKKTTGYRRKYKRNNTSNLDSSPTDIISFQKNFGPAKLITSFKDCYPNLQELLDIRKAHLQQVNITK